MVVKIRLSRFGKRHQPIYNIVVSQARYAAMLLNVPFEKLPACRSPLIMLPHLQDSTRFQANGSTWHL